MNLCEEEPTSLSKSSAEVNFLKVLLVQILIFSYCWFYNTIRPVLTELADILKREHNLVMPKEIHFQWDNCGENKVVKVMINNNLF